MANDSLKPLVFSGPSGVGKSTLLKRLFNEFQDKFGFSVSHTTRQPRHGEVDGVDYNFVSKEKMLQEVALDQFIEYAEFAGKMYGTSKASIQNVLNNNRICVLDVDEQGVKNIKKSEFKSIYIFISPPSLEELENRLRGRGTETDESLKKRMDTAQSALAFSKQTGVYDLVLVNDDLERAYQELKNYLQSNYPCLVINGAGDSGNTTHNESAIIDLGGGESSVNEKPSEEAGYWCSIL